MAKTCAELFEGISHTLIGNADELVEGLQSNSSQVKPHDMFFCIVGTKIDGHTFAQDAIDAGARVLVCERKLYLADATDVTLVVVPDSRRAMAEVASAFYDHPSSKLKLVGITGTNGKTTTTYLVDHIARYAGCTTGLIGTVGIHIAGKQKESTHTTPDSIELQQLLADMVKAGCDTVAMEVSSHALDLDRVWGCDFAVTAFSNLTQDHLDYHHTFEEYFAVKARLFSSDYPSKRVIGTNEKWGKLLRDTCIEHGDNTITFASDNNDATIAVVEVDYRADATKATFTINGELHSITYPLTGRFNVDNVMCAIGVCLQLGIELPIIIDALASAPSVPGRMQYITTDKPCDFSVIVDYAHTPDALEKAILSAREVTAGEVILVFGCEGNRDKGKRPIMGRISLNADKVVLTTDNSHQEDQFTINQEVLAGMLEVASSDEIALDAPGVAGTTSAADTAGAASAAGAQGAPESSKSSAAKVSVIPDRRTAMEYAMGIACPGDTILITGRGHEQYMEFGDDKIYFDDREQAREALDATLSTR